MDFLLTNNLINQASVRHPMVVMEKLRALTRDRAIFIATSSISPSAAPEPSNYICSEPPSSHPAAA
jgi:hypothetical protein